MTGVWHARLQQRGGAVAAVALVVLAVVAGVPGVAAASATSPAREVLTIVRAFAGMGEREDGNVVDPASHMGAPVYAQATLGDAALWAWRRFGDPVARAFGERMLAWVGGHPAGTPGSSFELDSAVDAYRLLPGSSPARVALGSWLRAYPVAAMGGLRYASNHDAVRADALLALCRLELRKDSERLCRAGRRLLDTYMAAAMRPYTLRSAGRSVALFSDPPHSYPAYHQLVMGYLARSIDAQGSVRGRAVGMLLAMARGTLAVAAPDGDVGYWGRCQEQSWAQAFGAYGLRVAADRDGDPAEAARFRLLADRLLARLAGRYFGGPYGIWIVPAMASDPYSIAAGIDDYANVTSYAGLTAVALMWLADELPRAGSPPSTAPSRLPNGGSLFPFGDDAFASSYHAGTWFAVREHGAFRRHGDLRSDFGLVAAQRRVGDRWVNLLAIRPRTQGSIDSTGPVLRAGRRTGYPDGVRISRRHDAAIVVSGGWRDRRGRWLRRASFRFSALRAGVRVRCQLHAGDRVTYSVFAPAPRRTADGIVDDRARTTLSLPAQVGFTRGYASAESSNLVRATLTARARRSEPVVISIRTR